MAAPRAPSTYLAIAGPLAEAALREARALPPGEIERLEAVLRPLEAPAGASPPLPVKHGQAACGSAPA